MQHQYNNILISTKDGNLAHIYIYTTIPIHFIDNFVSIIMSGLSFLAKKSWHPKNLKNVQKVARVEKEKRDEEKKMLELKKQIEEERQAMEYRKMQEANGGKVQSRRLEWMYNDAANKRDDDDDNNNNNGPNDKEEIEQFLLGKKSISEIVQQKTLKDMVPTMDGRGSSTAGSSTKAVPGARFIQDKPINEKNESFRRKHEDPLFAIMSNKESKRREILSNPVIMEKLRRERAKKEMEERKAKLLKKEMKKKRKEEKKKKKEKKKEKKRRKKEKKKLKKQNKKNKRLDSSSSDSDDSSGNDDDSMIQLVNNNNNNANTNNNVNQRGSNVPNNNGKTFGLQYLSNTSSVTDNNNNISNKYDNNNDNDASLGPTSYIIGKRKRYMEDNQDGKGNEFIRRKSSYQ